MVIITAPHFGRPFEINLKIGIGIHNKISKNDKV